MKYSPVIVMGMHRSGTSALVRALRDMGLFIGHDLEPNSEARYFLNLNEALLAMAGSRWDSPHSMLRVLEDEDLVAWMSGWLDAKMSGFETSLYLSKPNWFRYRDIRNFPQAWGWKDPRNVLTLPIWLKLFPDAKVIHVVRHPVDVASSLKVRELKLRDITLEEKANPEQWKVTSPQCFDLEYGVKLWETYVSAAEKALAAVPKQQQMTVVYEDWLSQPRVYLDKLHTWLNLDATYEVIQGITEGLHVDRRFAFKQDEKLSQFTKEKTQASYWIKHYYGNEGA